MFDMEFSNGFEFGDFFPLISRLTSIRLTTSQDLPASILFSAPRKETDIVLGTVLHLIH